MFTPGSKYLLGLTGLGVASFALYMLLVHPSAIGAVALVGLVLALCLLSGIALYLRDGQTDEAQKLPQSGDNLGFSMWPLVAASGFAMLLIGTITLPIVFILGIVVLVAAFVEWTVQAWSERGSSEVSFNSGIRQRLLNPLEYPVGAALGVGVITFLFSRVMLTSSRSIGPMLFIFAAAGILLVGMFVVMRPTVSKKLVMTIGLIALIGLVGAGVGSMGLGIRNELVVAAEENPYAHQECGKEKSEHFDSGVSESISATSGADAVVELSNGKLVARVEGIEGEQQAIVIASSTPTNIIFRNRNNGEFRLVAYVGTSKVANGVVEDLITCTQQIPSGAEQWLTLNIAKPSTASRPYTLTVPGLDGQSIEMLVP